MSFLNYKFVVFNKATKKKAFIQRVKSGKQSNFICWGYLKLITRCIFELVKLNRNKTKIMIIFCYLSIFP